MIRNYFITAFRSLYKHRSLSVINILGLAIGMTASFLLFQYVSYEFSYDQFHREAENIYRVQYDRYIDGELQYQKAQSFIPLGETLTSQYAEVAAYTTLFKISDQADIVLSHMDDEGRQLKYTEEDVYHVKGDFFNIFSVNIIEGKQEPGKVDDGKVLISSSMSMKYFGNLDALGKTITHPYYGDFVVSGVFENSPANSHIHFNFLFPWVQLTSTERGGDANNWHWDAFYNYIRLTQSTDPQTLEDRLPQFVLNYMSDRRNKQLDPVFSLQPITNIHLYSQLEGEVEDNASARSVYVLLLLGILIVVIAWINYVNLTTAKALDRAREVGVRKSLGSSRKVLVAQFLTESLIVNFISFLLAITLIQVVDFIFLQWLAIALPLHVNASAQMVITAFLAVLVGALVSGLYPALFISSFKPLNVLKGRLTYYGQSGKVNIRKALVVFQFTISIALIASTLVIFKQVTFMRTQSLGINIDQMLVARTLTNFGPPGADSLFIKKLEVVKQRLSAYPFIEGAAASSDLPGKEYLTVFPNFQKVDNAEEIVSLYYSRIDQDFIDAFEATLLSGRNFRSSESSSQYVMLNKEAVDLIGFDSPEAAIGEKVLYGNNGSSEAEVIGVVDFRVTSFKQANEPVVFQTYWAPMKFLSIRLNSSASQLDSHVNTVKDIWLEVFPDKPFDFFFLDQMFDQQYRSEAEFSKLINLFTGLAIFIACLGLYGLSLFSVKNRAKEIGVRKVLGASVRHLLGLLTRQVLILILIAGAIATPLSWVMLDQWLSNYTYRIDLGFVFFVSPIILMAVFALITVSNHVIKSASANPVDTLQDD